MNEFQTGSAPEQAAAYEFPSLAVLKAAHLKLLEQESAEASPEKVSSAFLADVRDFMLRASATGRILEDEKERGIAQTLINYWMTVLFRAGMRDEEIPRTSLAEFDESAGRDLDDSQCPYRGLDAYSESTAHLFFGRKQVIANWLEVLRQKRLLVVLGPSGSGKTSLICAGLLPALRAGGLPGSETWKVNETTLAGEDPASAFLEELEAEANNPRALLVVHRLDEIFLHCDRKTQHRLLAAIAKWVAAPGTERRAVTEARLESAVVLTQWLREENLAEIGKEAFIPPFEARELRAAIEEPAAQIGLHFEEGIIDTLINEFLGDPAALALVQFTLIRLWDRRERNHITWAAYRAMGGGLGAVETTAEAIYGATDFEKVDRDLTRNIFLRLVRPSLTRELVANSVGEAALANGPETGERVRKIIERFEKAQLVRVRTKARGERLIEVTHEALLRKWPRLLQWLDDARLELLQRQRIGVAAAQWREQGRDPSTLWTGVLLTAALSIRDQLSPSDRAFVDESRRASDRRRNRRRVLLTAAIVMCILILCVWLAILSFQRKEAIKAASGIADYLDELLAINLEDKYNSDNIISPQLKRSLLTYLDTVSPLVKNEAVAMLRLERGRVIVNLLAGDRNSALAECKNSLETIANKSVGDVDLKALFFRLKGDILDENAYRTPREQKESREALWEEAKAAYKNAANSNPTDNLLKALIQIRVAQVDEFVARDKNTEEFFTRHNRAVAELKTALEITDKLLSDNATNPGALRADAAAQRKMGNFVKSAFEVNLINDEKEKSAEIKDAISHYKLALAKGMLLLKTPDKSHADQVALVLILSNLADAYESLAALDRGDAHLLDAARKNLDDRIEVCRDLVQSDSVNPYLRSLLRKGYITKALFLLSTDGSETARTEARSLMCWALVLNPETIREEDLDSWREVLQKLGMTSEWETLSIGRTALRTLAAPP